MLFSHHYHNIILWFSEKSGASDAALHIHAGLTILLVTHIVSKRSLGTFIPFAFVALAEGTNEILDYLASGWRPTDTYADIVNTLIWPLAISLIARLQSREK